MSVATKSKRKATNPGSAQYTKSIIPDHSYLASTKIIDDSSQATIDTKSRKTKSLAYLATEFVRLVRAQENETIDVLYAAGMLGVEKRRIYDITNALIGANVLKKHGKSSYKWIGGYIGGGNEEESIAYTTQRKSIEKQCEELDNLIRDFSTYLENTYYSNPNIILTTEELVTSCQRPDNFQTNQTIIAISAPPGTDVYVTNNEKGKDNEIFLSSAGGEIRTYLLPSTNENSLLNPHSLLNNPLLTPFTPSLPSSSLTISTPIIDYGLSQEANQLLGFSNDFGLQDLFLE